MAVARFSSARDYVAGFLKAFGNNSGFIQASTLVDSSGTEITPAASPTEYTEDAAAAANPIGGAVILVRRDTLTAAEVTTDGDNVAMKGTGRGQAHVYDLDANTVLGAINGAAVVTDGNGSIQQYLRGIIVKLIAQLPATLGIKTAANSLSVAPASDAIFATSAPIGGTYTDRSIANLSGASETLMASNASRRVLVVHNIGATSVAVNLTGGTASLTVGGSVVLTAGNSLVLDNYPSSSAITIIGTLNADVTAYEG